MDNIQLFTVEKNKNQLYLSSGRNYKMGDSPDINMTALETGKFLSIISSFSSTKNKKIIHHRMVVYKIMIYMFEL